MERVDSTTLDRIPSWRIALDVARDAGWDIIATGDWSWVHRSPDGTLAWRITPFDPAFDAFAELCTTSENGHLPRIEATHVHCDGGSSTVMELLEPVNTDAAESWLRDFESCTTNALAELRQLLEDVARRSTIPLFAGIDSNPANVLARPGDARLVLTDAYWINGPHLLELVKSHPDQALQAYPATALEDWAHLPCMDSNTTAMILRQIGAAGR